MSDARETRPEPQTMHLYWWGGTFIVSKSLEMDFASQIGFQAFFGYGISFVQNVMMKASRVYCKGRNYEEKKFSNYSLESSE